MSHHLVNYQDVASGPYGRAGQMDKTTPATRRQCARDGQMCTHASDEVNDSEWLKKHELSWWEIAKVKGCTDAGDCQSKWNVIIISHYHYYFYFLYWIAFVQVYWMKCPGNVCCRWLYLKVEEIPFRINSVIWSRSGYHNIHSESPNDSQMK